MSKKPPIVILPPLTPPLDDELPLDGEPPLPGAPGMAAGLAPVVFAWVPETSPCWTATAEAGWLDDLTRITPRPGPSPMGGPRRRPATRSPEAPRPDAHALVAAVPEDGVLSPQPFLERSRESAQHRVASSMAHGIVRLFEPVDVDERDSERSAVTAGARHLPLRRGHARGAAQHA